MTRVTTAFQRAALALSLGLAVATCRDAPMGPGRGYRADLALAPVLPPQAAHLAAFGLAIDSLRVVIVRPPTDTVVDRTVAFTADQDSLSLALSLILEERTEVFDVAVELRGGGFVLFSAVASVEVVAGRSNRDEPLEISDFVYSGPGADVTTLVVSPADSVIRWGDSLRFRVDALADGIPVTQFYVSWTTSDETVAPINARGVLRAPVLRGAVTVTAATPTGVSASVPVTFVPAPVSVLAVPPIPQNVPPATEFGLLRARVLAADGLGVKGTPVTFQAVSGGGSVANTIVVTDGAGYAETPATSGTGALSVFTASVAGVAAPATFTVAVRAPSGTQLAFAVPPGGAVVGIPFGAVVEIRDAQGNLAVTATDPVTIALGANPGEATLGGTLTVNAVAGVAVFADLTLNQSGSGYTVVATAPGLTQAVSPPFNVIDGFAGRVWTNAAGGNWSDPANWSGAIVPGATDTVHLVLDGSYTVTLDANVTVAILFLGGGSGTQTLSVSSRSLRVDDILIVGATGVLQVTAGTIAGEGGTVFNQGRLSLQSATVTSSVYNFTAGVFVARGNTTVAGSFTNGIEALARIEGDAACCGATLTVSGDVVNLGFLELTAVNEGGNHATLEVPTGIFVNAAGATIAVLAGTGGGRVLDAPIENQGTLMLGHDVTLTRSISSLGAVEWTAGSVTVANGSILDVLPTGSFAVSSTGQWNGLELPATIAIQARANMKVTTAGSVGIGPLVFLNNAGALDIQAPAALKMLGDFSNLSGGDLLGTGTLDVGGSPKVTNVGTLRPGGDAPGVLTIVAPPGGWPQGLGSGLVIDIAGTTPGLEYDQVVVLGAAILGGTINVNRTITGGRLTLYYPLTATVDIGGLLLPGNLDQLLPPMSLPLPDLGSTPKRVILLQL